MFYFSFCRACWIYVIIASAPKLIKANRWGTPYLCLFWIYLRVLLHFSTKNTTPFFIFFYWNCSSPVLFEAFQIILFLRDQLIWFYVQCMSKFFKTKPVGLRYGFFLFSAFCVLKFDLSFCYSHPSLPWLFLCKTLPVPHICRYFIFITNTQTCCAIVWLWKAHFHPIFSQSLKKGMSIE
jgi:hypothetical protein